VVSLVKPSAFIAELKGATVPRLSRAEQREETRRRLIEAAARVFIRVGFEAAPIDVIAEEAGFSRGAFYSNFSTKDEVFLLLLKQHLADELETLEAGLQRIKKPQDMAPAIERRYRALGEDSGWCLLATEFQLYAMRGGAKAGEFTRIYEDYRMRLGRIIEGQCARLGVQLGLSPYEFGVAQVALAHGLALQRAANPKIAASLAPRALSLFFEGAALSGAKKGGD